MHTLTGKGWIFLLLAVVMLFGCQPRYRPDISHSTPEASSSAAEPQVVSLPEEPLPPPLPEPEQPRRLTLVAVGDLMAHWDQIEDALTPEGDYDFTHSFEAVKEDLSQGYTLGNLETVFGGEALGYSSYPRFSTPDAYGKALKEAGFDFVSTCNNHSLDRDAFGVLRTLEVLDSIGLAHTGSYASKEDAQNITIVEAQGMKIAILAFTFSTNGIPLPKDAPWMVNMLTTEKMVSDFQKARALNPDLIVAMPHMGNEYETYTRDVFLDWMDLMLYHGADLVLASHPHVLQPMMMRELTDVEGVTRQGFIIASLGNFISVQREEPRDMSIILKIDLSQQEGQRPVIESVRFVPIWVSYRDNTGNVNIRVVPVGDALKGLEGDNPLGLNPWDADRLKRANRDIVSLFLGESAIPEKVEREYVFYQRHPPAAQNRPECNLEQRQTKAQAKGLEQRSTLHSQLSPNG